MASERVLSVEAPTPLLIQAGGKGEVRIRGRVADSYHVQANPAANAFLIPVQLRLRGTKGIRPGRPVYPPGQPYRLEGSDSDLLTYGGTFEIVVALEADEGAVRGDYVLSGQLRYQACDTRSCLFPAAMPISIGVHVLGYETPTAHAEPSLP